MMKDRRREDSPKGYGPSIEENRGNWYNREDRGLEDNQGGAGMVWVRSGLHLGLDD